MDKFMDLTIALDILNRRIANLNIKLASTKDEVLEEKLSALLKYREEIRKGNNELIEKVINEFNKE